METETYYDILGLRPDASHHQILRAFGELAGRYHKQAATDPSARDRLQEAKAAYQILTNFESRLKYNIERGLPDPPRHVKGDEGDSPIEGLTSLIPGDWHIYAFILVFIILQVAFFFERAWVWHHTRNLIP